jgi:2-octaprenyl-6-methoxyphenol hydroxylase
MVGASTDGFTRLFGAPGRPARAIRRLGMAAVERIGPLKNYFMAEARGEMGQMPKLLQGLEL